MKDKQNLLPITAGINSHSPVAITDENMRSTLKEILKHVANDPDIRQNVNQIGFAVEAEGFRFDADEKEIKADNVRFCINMEFKD